MRKKKAARVGQLCGVQIWLFTWLKFQASFFRHAAQFVYGFALVFAIVGTTNKRKQNRKFAVVVIRFNEVRKILNYCRNILDATPDNAVIVCRQKQRDVRVQSLGVILYIFKVRGDRIGLFGVKSEWCEVARRHNRVDELFYCFGHITCP